MEMHLGQILLEVAIAVVAVLAFIGLAPAKLGDKIFGHYLDRRLTALKHDQDLQIESLRHDHNQDIEELRAKLAHVGDRGIRSNEREFQAVTAAWEHFHDAYNATMLCAVAFKQYPDFQRMPDIEIEQYLQSTDLTDRQREMVMKADDKRATFSRLVDLNQINAAGRAIYEARNLIGRQAIFIPDDLFASFEAKMMMLSRAQIQRSMDTGYRASEHVEFMIKNGQHERALLLAAIRQRIFSADNPDMARGQTDDDVRLCD
jgi:hypothetical protein